MIPTTDLDAGSATEAACTYDIRADGPDGPPMRFANVGDKAYHVWSCATNGSDTTAMKILVHECVASDEASKKMVPIVDLKG